MSVNRITLLGNVGQDPKVRYLDTGVCVAQFSLATTVKGYTTQSGQEIADRTEWHNLVAWRGIAQTIEKYVHKGDKLYVEGELRYRDYEDKDGVRKRLAEIYVESMELLGNRGTSGGAGGTLPPDPLAPAQPKTQQPQPQQPAAQPVQQPKPAAPQQQIDFTAEASDDLPF